MPMHMHFGFALKPPLRKDMIRAGSSNESHRSGRQRVEVLFDLADINAEQPGMGFVDKDHTVTLVFIENLKQRRDVSRIAPARLVANRRLDLARPEKIFRVVGETNQSL